MELVTDIYQDDEEDSTDVSGQIKAISQGFTLHSDFIKKQEEESNAAMNKLLNDNPLAKKVYCKEYHIAEEDLDLDYGGHNMLGDIDAFYDDFDPNADNRTDLQKRFDALSNLR